MVDAFSPFDAADYLSDFDDATAYLEAVIDEGDDDPAQITQGARHRRRQWRGRNGHCQLKVDPCELSAWG